MAKEKATSILLGLPSGGDQNKNNGFNNKWIYLSGVLFLALAAAIYRLYFYEECPQIDFELSTIQNSEGAMFKFYDFTPGADTWEWDFGDGAGISSERSPIHLYNQAGTYDVMLTINGTCTKFQTITIIQETPRDQRIETSGSPLITSVDSSDVYLADPSAATKFDPNPPTEVAARLVPVADPSITINQPVATSTPTRNENVARQQSVTTTENTTRSQVPTRQTTTEQTTARQEVSDTRETVTRQASNEPENTNPLENPVATESLGNNPPQTEVGYIPSEPEPYQTAATDVEAVGILTDLDIKTMVFDVSELRQLPSDVMNSFCKGSMDRTIVDANNTTMSMGDFFDRIEGKPIRIKSFIVHRDPQDNNCIVGMKIKYGKVRLF